MVSTTAQSWKLVAGRLPLGPHSFAEKLRHAEPGLRGAQKVL
jgi:hypothetical protein